MCFTSLPALRFIHSSTITVEHSLSSFVQSTPPENILRTTENKILHYHLPSQIYYRARGISLLIFRNDTVSVTVIKRLHFYYYINLSCLATLSRDRA